MFRLKVADEPPDEIDILFKEYSQHGIMSMDDLCDFLVQFQGEEEGVAIKKHAQTIFDSLRHLNIFHRRGLHVEAFFRYLLSDLNVPLAEVHHDMNFPLAHYFLYTGHNSYLTGNQVSSASSTSAIIKALKKGVRVIELDLWPNSRGDDVLVHHGGTKGYEKDIGLSTMTIELESITRSLPGSNALYGSSTVSKEQGPLHRRPDVVKSKQGFPHFRERVWVKKLVHDRMIRFGTWNIGTLTGKSMEIVDVMVRRKINFMCLQETKWTGEKAKELDNSGFKLWYTGKIRSRNGVGIIVDKEWKKDVVDDIPQGEKVFLGGDLNGHVGSVARGFEGVYGGFGLGEMNEEGKSILEFSEALDLSIANTWFKKREEHLITYKSGGTCSQIDFFLIRKSDRKYCLNCKVIPGESLTTQHRVLVMDVRIRDRAKRRSPLVAPRIKWWHLKGEKQGIFQQKIWEGWCGQSQGSANDMWNKMSQEIIKVAKETLGESRGFGPRGKESWWWNENVQSKVRVKKECFKEWSRCRNSETWDKYKIARNETKKAVSEARAQAFDGLYQALGTRDGERSIYRLAKGRERKTRDLDQVKCVKDEEGKVLVHEKDIKERWKAYFHNLFNDGYGYDSSSLDTREEDRNYEYYRRIQKQEVKEALKRMSNGKAVGPDNIPIEVWKTLGDRGLEWLTELFNEIMRSKRMPEEWRRSTLVPIYKNKGDIQNCANYRGIKLMSHTMKLWERVIERRLRKETQVTENQFGFMPGRSTMEAIYLLRRVMEQYRMAQQDLHLIFIDLEKAYDRVPREILWKALEKKGVRVAYIRAIQDMYDRVSTSVRTQGGESDDFPITIGLHQGSTLSPYLFTLILDVLTEQIQEIAPRCMLFADDIVLLGESREELNERLETWRRALETHGFRLSRSKSEYMECKFNKRRRVSNSEVKIGDHIIPQVTRFKYLGSVIQDDGEIEGDVNHRIQAGWMKWRKASGVLCDAKVPIKLKGKFYRTAVRSAILYGTECWAVKSQHENKVGVAEMRMLRWMCGKTRQDKIRNEAIRERVGVAPIVEKMVENRLRWFGHVERRPVDSVVKRVDQMERRQTIRGRGRPKKTIREVIKKDLEINGLDRRWCRGGHHLRYMEGIFGANGGCGYVKKPDILLNVGPNNEVFDPRAIRPVQKILQVLVYMGEGWRSDFGPTHFDFYSPPDFRVQVGIRGVPDDKDTKYSRTIEDDWVPVWNEEFSFPLTVPELALFYIKVVERDFSGRHDFGGQTCLPVSELRQGIRAVR
ncbi:Phosphoinositide phospholipase C 6 [Glycine max]|nr:Phosphoinositide phospholipase C 6 [Glycine max]